MENATKALLIAAAVLIAIVLIALGVRLIGSTKNTSEDAGAVANQLQTSTNIQANTMINSLQGF